ncbi:MAG: hypothetical protein R2880_18415 [Deinococcales bacterium]
MTRQMTIERIHQHLTCADDVLLESLLVLLERTQSNLKTLDVWDEQIIADCESGQFDDLIADILEAISKIKPQS